MVIFHSYVELTDGTPCNISSGSPIFSQTMIVKDHKYHMEVSKNRGSPKWMVDHVRSHYNECRGTRGSPILGHLHISHKKKAYGNLT